MQLFRQHLADAGFASAHKADQQNDTMPLPRHRKLFVFCCRQSKVALLALLDADCTTEGMELNRGGTRVSIALKRFSRLRREVGMLFLLKRKIVLHRSTYRLSFYLHRCGGVKSYVARAGVRRQLIG